MKRNKKIRVLVLCLALVALFCGCQTPAGRTPGQVVDDATITTKVKSKIFADSVLKGFAISVETFQGEVTLTGAVATKSSKERAEKITAGTAGVRRVNNLLKVD